MINTGYLNWVHRKKKGMKNDEQDENSPVELIYERLKRLHMTEIDGRERLRLWEEEGGRARKTNTTGRENQRIS